MKLPNSKSQNIYQMASGDCALESAKMASSTIEAPIVARFHVTSSKPTLKKVAQILEFKVGGHPEENHGKLLN